MDWKKLIGFGVGLYVVMFIYWSLLVAFGAGEAAWGWYLGFVVLAIAAHSAGARLGTKNVTEILKYSAGWVVIMAVLDFLISTRFTGPELFSAWQLYVSYAILLLVPLATVWCKCPCCKVKGVEAARQEAPSAPEEPSQPSYE